MAVRTLALALALGAGVAGVTAYENADVTSLQAELEDVLNETDYKNLKKSKAAKKKELQMAFCVIDAIQAAVSLGQAGVGIAEATHSCKPYKDPDTGEYKVPKGKEAACAETITFIITTFGHVAVFLSGAASQCAEAINFEAYCAQDVTDMFTGLSLMAEAGSGMAANCKGGADYNKYNKENADDADGRRLGSNLSLALRPTEDDARRLAEEKSQEQKDIGIGMCVFDVLQAAMFAARAGAMVQEVVYACKETERVEYTYDKEHEIAPEGIDVNSLGSVNKIVSSLKDKSLYDAQAYVNEANEQMAQDRRLGALVKLPRFNITVEDKKHAQRICAVCVLHMISSFAYVGSFLSFSAAKCATKKNYDAACAGGIINTITSLSIVSASALDFENSCDQVNKNHTGESHTAELPGGRRLKEATDALASMVV